MSQLTRRELLRAGLAAATGLATRRSMLGMLGGGLAATANAATGDYKALVCVYLSGGNDGFNVMVPTDTSRYNVYKASRANLATAQASLLPLVNTAVPATAQTYGLAPSMPELQKLYQRGRAAFVSNLGTLVAPVTKSDVQAGRNLPPQLYSHNDQQESWMASQLDAVPRLGWAGRVAELMSTVNANPRLSMNMSIAGNNLLQTGSQSAPYSLTTAGVQKFSVASMSYMASQRNAAMQSLLSQAQGADALQAYGSQITQSSMDLANEVGNALAAVPAFTTVYPSNNALASQLLMVAKAIAARNSLSMSRQVFFVQMNGFDLHNDQLNSHPALLTQVSQAMSAFDATMEELGISGSVTAFTASDFGRTLTSNGDGTDHAWGNVQWAVGGAVQGGKVYGTFPNQAIGSADDAGGGRIIPTTSVEQYGATLLRWFGVSDSNLATVFPHLSRFSTSNLGFI